MVLRLEDSISMIIREGGMDGGKDRKQGGEVGRGTNRAEMNRGEEEEQQPKDFKKGECGGM